MNKSLGSNTVLCYTATCPVNDYYYNLFPSEKVPSDKIIPLLRMFHHKWQAGWLAIQFCLPTSIEHNSISGVTQIY